MLFKRFLAAIAVACCVVLGSTSWAAAASNGNHDQGFTCTTGTYVGSTQPGSPTVVHGVFSYHVTGVGADEINHVYADQFVWDTSPAVDLDGINIGLGDTSSPSGTFWQVFSIGSGSNSLNDHGTVLFPSGTHRDFHNGTPGWLQMLATGGSGNYNGSCLIGHAVL